MTRFDTRRLWSLFGALVLWAAGTAWAAELGRVHDVLPELGTVDPRSQPVEEGRLLHAVNEPAIVHLDNGQVLRLDANTAVKLEAAGPAEVEVTVLSGRVLLWAGADGALEAGSGSWFVVGPATADPLAAEARLLAEPQLARPARGRRAALRR